MTDQLARPGALGSASRTLVFHRSIPLPCPYVGGRFERRILAELSPDMVSGGLFDDLTAAGFRRSHNVIYRPACPACTACVPVRIVVERFRPNRSMRRTWRANADLAVELLSNHANQEQYTLFRHYQASRHGGGEMALMTDQDYRGLVEQSPVNTQLAEARTPDGRLVACCLVDRTGDGLSAVYSFFEPEPAERGLGSFMILWLVEAARALGLDYVYLGYWIEECRKMSYKARYGPLEALGPDGWAELPPEACRVS